MNEPFVPIEDLAKHLTVSVSTVRAWVRQGLIPEDTYIKVSNTYRFCVSKVVNALTKQPKNEQDTEPVTAPTQQEKVPVQLELDFSNPDDDL